MSRLYQHTHSTQLPGHANNYLKLIDIMFFTLSTCSQTAMSHPAASVSLCVQKTSVQALMTTFQQETN